MIAIVSHDAGGAEILSSWVRHQSERYLLVLDGPAKTIFGELGPLELSGLKDAVARADWVLTGTSWQSSLENEAIECSTEFFQEFRVVSGPLG